MPVALAAALLTPIQGKDPGLCMDNADFEAMMAKKGFVERGFGISESGQVLIRIFSNGAAYEIVATGPVATCRVTGGEAWRNVDPVQGKDA